MELWKKIKITPGMMLLLVLPMTAGNLQARDNYLGLSAGLHFNLGDLGLSITIRGLDGTIGNPTFNGAGRLAGCTAATALPDCQSERGGDDQQLIVPENVLISLEKATAGAIRATQTTGPMTGLVLGAFWESEGRHTWWRAGLDYTRRIRGGRTEATALGIKWYDIEWDYLSVFVPFYWGLRTGIGERSGAYIGFGLNWHWGGWDLRGDNFGDLPSFVLGLPIGATTVNDAITGVPKGGPVLAESTRYRVSGFGLNIVFGLDLKLAGGNKIFFEIDRKIAGAYGKTVARSLGAQRLLSPITAYPIVLGGTVYRFGYKISM